MKRAAVPLETIDTTSKARAISEIAADMLARRGRSTFPGRNQDRENDQDRVEEIAAGRDAAVATGGKAPRINRAWKW